MTVDLAGMHDEDGQRADARMDMDGCCALALALLSHSFQVLSAAQPAHRRRLAPRLFAPPSPLMLLMSFSFQMQHQRLCDHRSRTIGGGLERGLAVLRNVSIRFCARTDHRARRGLPRRY